MRVNTGLAKRCRASQIRWFFEGLHQHMDENDSGCIISLEFRQPLLKEQSRSGMDGILLAERSLMIFNSCLRGEDGQK